jgi:hypothetical protein
MPAFDSREKMIHALTQFTTGRCPATEARHYNLYVSVPATWVIGDEPRKPLAVGRSQQTLFVLPSVPFIIIEYPDDPHGEII